MRYLSVCSGIEAATQAWHPLGWEAVAFSEIEPFPCAVLAHHYPHVPNWGDMTRFEEWPDADIDVLGGGTPCQDYSVAGLRLGMAGSRGQLTLTFVEIAARYRPRFIVWENVFGVLSSNGGRDFARFLGDLCGQTIPVPEGGWQNSGIIPGISDAYGLAYRVLDAQYVRVDGLERAVPQRRRRVFVVGYLGDWRRAAAVLFERESLSGHPAPRREAGQGVAPTIAARTHGGGGLGTDFDCDGGLIAFGGNNTSGAIDVATACQAHGGPHGRQDFGSETFVVHPYTLAIRGRGDSHNLEYRTDGTANAVLTPNGGRAGIGVGAIAFDTTQITSAANRSNPRPGDPCHPLAAGAHPPAIAFSAKDHGADAAEGVSPTLRAGGHTGSHANAGVMPAIAFDARQSDVIQYGEKTGPLDTDGHTMAVQHGWAVRRLTPVECEKLQGFPPGWTDVPYRGKPAADGPRYKALGNSFAVNVVRWIGQRIALVDAIGRSA